MEKWKAKRRTILKYTVLTAAGILLFQAAEDYTYVWRGHKALGGEAFLLLLPVFYCLISKTIRDITAEIWMLSEEREEDKDGTR